jgi:His/Glu/Gln/Arg/opine family amino acid ABC transporter permease subunit
LDFSFLPKYYMFYLEGMKNTLFLSIFAVLLGVVLGTFISLMRLSNNKLIKFIATAYIEFIRGTPVLIQLYIIFYGLPKIGIHLPDFIAAIVTLSINSAAYVAEIIRAGIQAVEKGQMEAARSLGLSHPNSMRYIIIPQAVKNILPALGNEFITVIKESSIVSFVGIAELSYNADTIRGNTFIVFEPLIIAAILYFIMTFSLSKLIGHFERKMKTSD